MLTFNWYPFSALTIEQLYAILALRAEVFVVEQQCNYLDPDGKDCDALHLLGYENSKLAAYIRLFPPTNTENHLIFGRVVTAKEVRNQGVGKKLLQALLDYCETNFPAVPIKCSAQSHLTAFYEGFGFKTFGEPYDEDHIPHIGMVRDSR